MKSYWITVIILVLSLDISAQASFKDVQIGSNAENGQHATIDGLDIYYETYGEGTPLLLLHGGLGSISNFKKCLPNLATQFKVIALDSPGHGRSGQTDSLSYPLLADYLSKFIDHLQLDSLYVMGWSDGGVIGFLLAADRPDKVKKLVAVGANTRLDGLEAATVNWIRNDLIEWAKGNTHWLEQYLSLTPQSEKIDNYLKNTQSMWLTEVYVPENKMKNIQIPTLILQGDKDLMTLEHTTEMYRSIKNAQLCILPNASHFCLEEKPELITTIVINFLKAGGK